MGENTKRPRGDSDLYEQYKIPLNSNVWTSEAKLYIKEPAVATTD